MAIGSKAKPSEWELRRCGFDNKAADPRWAILVDYVLHPGVCANGYSIPSSLYLRPLIFADWLNQFHSHPSLGGCTRRARVVV
jgi:hypothetical protein